MFALRFASAMGLASGPRVSGQSAAWNERPIVMRPGGFALGARSFECAVSGLLSTVSPRARFARTLVYINSGTPIRVSR
jgi:hypothetical protein